MPIRRDRAALPSAPRERSVTERNVHVVERTRAVSTDRTRRLGLHRTDQLGPETCVDTSARRMLRRVRRHFRCDRVATSSEELRRKNLRLMKWESLIAVFSLDDLVTGLDRPRASR
jgi:hypothetical protein